MKSYFIYKALIAFFCLYFSQIYQSLKDDIYRCSLYILYSLKLHADPKLLVPFTGICVGKISSQTHDTLLMCMLHGITWPDTWKNLNSHWVTMDTGRGSGLSGVWVWVREPALLWLEAQNSRYYQACHGNSHNPPSPPYP